MGYPAEIKSQQQQQQQQQINITETAPNFSESTTVSSIYAESEAQRRNLRDIYIGHLHKLHYLSTISMTQSTSTDTTCQASDKPQEILQNSQLTKTSLKETATIKKLENRKQYMKEYMKQKRRDNIFKKKKLKEKNHIIKSIKIQMLKKLKDRGKEPQQHTENEILRMSSSLVKKQLTITDKPIWKKLKNLAKNPLQHTEN